VLYGFGALQPSVSIFWTVAGTFETRNPQRLPFDLSPAAQYEYEWEICGCGFAALRMAWLQ
jgi:hypothetical protein